MANFNNTKFSNSGFNISVPQVKWTFISVAVALVFTILLSKSCTVVDSGEIGIKFHKWDSSKEKYGGVEGTCKGWVFYNPITTKVFTYPTYLQRKNYEPFNVNAKDASTFQMDPTIAYRIDPAKACDIFVKYREGVHELENGYIRTCIYEAYRTCANRYTSDSLMSSRANFESDVRHRLESSLQKEGFIVEEFTSQITPPQSLAQMINEKNAAVQSALKAKNKVAEAEAEAKIKIAEAKGAAEAMQIKADVAAYYNTKIAASLSQHIVQEDWIEKWDGHLPTVTGSGGGMILDLKDIKK